MPALSVTAIKNHRVSDDGQQATLTFTTKYVGDLDVTMPVACIDELVAMANRVKSEGDSKSPKDSTQLKVTTPKTWLVTAELKQHSVVILAFDHQTETRVGYALTPEAAKKIGVSLGQNAEVVLNRKTTGDAASQD